MGPCVLSNPDLPSLLFLAGLFVAWVAIALMWRFLKKRKSCGQHRVDRGCPWFPSGEGCGRVAPLWMPGWRKIRNTRLCSNCGRRKRRQIKAEARHQAEQAAAANEKRIREWAADPSVIEDYGQRRYIEFHASGDVRGFREFLCSQGAYLPVELLKQIATTSDFRRVRVVDYDEGGLGAIERTEGVNCSAVRRAANEALIRRKDVVRSAKKLGIRVK